METVKDLMVPVAEYATVHEDQTLGVAIRTLARVREKRRVSGEDYRPRGLLVLGQKNRVVGKLSQMDIVMNLEPKYRTTTGSEALAHTATAGLSPELLKSMMDWYSLWDESFEQRCQKVLNMEVKDCMHLPRKDEYVREEETLEVAIHQLVMGRHQHLLVTRDRNIVGILRLSDLFERVADLMEKLEESRVSN